MNGSEATVAPTEEKKPPGRSFMGHFFRLSKVVLLNPLGLTVSLILIGSFFRPDGRTNSKNVFYADLVQNLARKYRVVKNSFLEEENLATDSFEEKKLSQNLSFAAVFFYLCATSGGAFFLQKRTLVTDQSSPETNTASTEVANGSTTGAQENLLQPLGSTKITHFWNENMILGPISVFLKTLTNAKDHVSLNQDHLTILVDDVTAAEPKILCAQYFLSTTFFITLIVLVYYAYHWVYNIFFRIVGYSVKGITPILYNRLLVVQNLRKVALMVFLNGSTLYCIAAAIINQSSQNGHLICNYEPSVLFLFYCFSAIFYLLMEIYERLNPAMWSPNGPLYQALKHKKVVTVQSWRYEYWPTVYLYRWTVLSPKSTNSTITKAEQYNLLWLKKDSLDLKLKNFWVFVYFLNLLLIPPFLLFAAPGLLVITILDFGYEIVTRTLMFTLQLIYFRRPYLRLLYWLYPLITLFTGLTLTNFSLLALKENTSVYEILKEKLTAFYDAV